MWLIDQLYIKLGYVLQKRVDHIVPRLRDEHLAEFSQPSFKKTAKKKLGEVFPKDFHFAKVRFGKKTAVHF